MGRRELIFGAIAGALVVLYVWVATLVGPVAVSGSATPAPSRTRPAERTGVPRVPGSIAFVLAGDVYVLRDGRYAPLTSEGRSMSPDLTDDGATLYFARREEIDGKRIADGALVNARLGFSRIVRKPAAGGDEQVIVDGLRQKAANGQDQVSWYLDPAAAPDGKRVAVIEDDGGGAADLVVVTPANGNGRAGVLILSQGAQLADPAWSPDGKTIALTSYNTDVPGILLWASDRPGVAQRLQDLPDGGAYRPSFSPDGRWIVYTLRGDGANDVHAYEIATKRDVRLTSDGRSWNGVFSPDGKWIAFLRETSGTIDLFAMELGDALAGGPPKAAVQLTRGEGIDGASRPSWSR